MLSPRSCTLPKWPAPLSTFHGPFSSTWSPLERLWESPSFHSRCPKLWLAPGNSPHLPCCSPSLPRVTADGGDKDQAALWISGSLLSSLLRCWFSAEHLQVQLCCWVIPTLSAIKQHFSLTGRQKSFSLAHGGVLPKQVLEQHPRARGVGAQLFWQGQWFTKHWGRFSAGANWCCLPDFHPGQLICAICRAGASLPEHRACLSKDPGMLAGFDWVNGCWGCCLPHVI